MSRKTSPERKKVPEITQYKNQKQSIDYQATIKRQSTFFSRWKDRRALIIYIPNQEFSLTLYNKNKNTTDQIVNLHLTKISRRCLVVQQHYCFGLELKSGKRYLLGGPNKAQVSSAFDLIGGLKKLLSQNSQLSRSSHEKQGNKIKQQKQQLEFQRSNDGQQMQNSAKEEQKIKMVSTSYSPLSKTYEREFEKEEENRQNDLEMQRESDYCTVLQEEQIVLQQQQQAPLHLKIPLQKEQLEYLQSDENFRLIQNFSQGRILQKNKHIIKANLVFKTHLTSQQLLESFFHLELWNQKVKNYQLKNRIDQGIYLVELQLNKRGMFSSPKHCFIMVTTLTINKEHYLIMKSLERNTFQQKKGTEWLDLAIWLKVRGQDNLKMNRFVSLCAAVQNGKDYQQVLAFFLQIKCYQSFLLTTSRLPTRVLQWRKEQENQIFIK